MYRLALKLELQAIIKRAFSGLMFKETPCKILSTTQYPEQLVKCYFLCVGKHNFIHWNFYILKAETSGL